MERLKPFFPLSQVVSAIEAAIPMLSPLLEAELAEH